jgi:hypothetical protein
MGVCKEWFPWETQIHPQDVICRTKSEKVFLLDILDRRKNILSSTQIEDIVARARLLAASVDGGQQ